jgi:hypothetical protein
MVLADIAPRLARARDQLMLTDPYYRAYTRFTEDTAEHQLKIMHDDDLYRHLRCTKPGTWIYGFDIITWPGHLAVSGDVGDFVFRRVTDMFEFFELSRGIDPYYWSQKLTAPNPRDVRVFSEEKYIQHVHEWLEEAVEFLDEDLAQRLRAAAKYQLLDEWEMPRDTRSAIELLQEFEFDFLGPQEPWEWDLTEYSHQFLWCCWAIKWAIEQYREQANTNEETKS